MNHRSTLVGAVKKKKKKNETNTTNLNWTNYFYPDTSLLLLAATKSKRRHRDVRGDLCWPRPWSSSWLVPLCGCSSDEQLPHPPSLSVSMGDEGCSAPSSWSALLLGCMESSVSSGCALVPSLSISMVFLSQTVSSGFAERKVFLCVTHGVAQHMTHD